ncbi:MAG: hypothetical protein RIA63_05380, partial [Cyclobacteriaceae bacterium]
RLNNGVVYQASNRPNYKEENKFFDSRDWLEADIVYDGQLFKSVYLKYDLVIDKVILEYPPAGELQLIDQLVSSFSISGHQFTRLDDGRIEKGFYEIFFDGKIKLYEKHHKVFVKSIEQQRVVLQYISRNQTYLFKDGNYYQVKSNGSFYNIFEKETTKALKKYARANSISINKDGRGAMVRLAKYYLESIDD